MSVKKRMMFTLSLLGCWAAFACAIPVRAAEDQGNWKDKCGVSEYLDSTLTQEEYLDAVCNTSAFGYSNLGVAKVDNHLNVRETPSEDGKLVGKMTNNAACEVIEYVGDWAHITSGKVEGYCHTDYLLTGPLAVKAGEAAVVKEAVSTSGGLRVREEPGTTSTVITSMAEGESLEVIEDEKDGWIKVQVDDMEGYISAEYAEVREELDTAITMTELLYGMGVSDLRVDLCQYAKEFIGNPYVWGGTSLTKGADCSGFTMSIFKKYGISLPHSSVAQSKMGTRVSLNEAKAGDLVFYSSGGRVNHVAIYIGGGQVVHASNPRTGIRISDVGYRSIATIRRIIND
ncbi:MAG: SH3 domain-containing protein [Lachnospiraceae bacterium]|nr:SH3 domain-containing protein [Lachnospiraceae bacterium]